MTMDEIELFRCHFCLRHKPIGECKQVWIKGKIFPVDACSNCVELAKKGIYGEGTDKESTGNKESTKEDKG
ncbi:hypothetical protein A2Z67_00035 [Candidatus Woesebacteria bacterium RBG_13_36_22]|uniref:Uncharacterized protein n=1 Tax=Candidatus Woesebacteria bacterium RBG_13_36_22 TaxID=1802478 RepID=A0A1F7X7D7_9BACT|nr:MAG: hypothetical protein A2Z67_00035 [Candidatus Woesebacteria bacterium RBG_13_36_22]